LLNILQADITDLDVYHLAVWVPADLNPADVVWVEAVVADGGA
jgi:hypothetical protein